MDKTYPGFWNDISSCLGVNYDTTLYRVLEARSDIYIPVKENSASQVVPSLTDHTPFTDPGFGDDCVLDSNFGRPCGFNADGADHSLGSIIIIGMRGAGKTRCGRAAALRLGMHDATIRNKYVNDYSMHILGFTFVGMPFFDMDQQIELHLGGESIVEFVDRRGWSEFRALELEVIPSLTLTA